jgi:hypothetical protein
MKQGLEKMFLGELINKIVIETINYVDGLWNEDSPYDSKEEINKQLREQYLKKIKELKDELNKRERFYLRR